MIDHAELNGILGIDIRRLEAILQKRDIPLLVACVRNGSESRRQNQVLERVFRLYENRLRLGVIMDRWLDTFMRDYDVAGTPTYLMFINGKEVDRYMGVVAEPELAAFIWRCIHHGGTDAGLGEESI